MCKPSNPTAATTAAAAAAAVLTHAAMRRALPARTASV